MIQNESMKKQKITLGLTREIDGYKQLNQLSLENNKQCEFQDKRDKEKHEHNACFGNQSDTLK